MSYPIHNLHVKCANPIIHHSLITVPPFYLHVNLWLANLLLIWILPQYCSLDMKEWFGDTKGVVRSRKSKDRQWMQWSKEQEEKQWSTKHHTETDENKVCYFNFFSNCIISDFNIHLSLIGMKLSSWGLLPPTKVDHYFSWRKGAK